MSRFLSAFGLILAVVAAGAVPSDAATFIGDYWNFANSASLTAALPFLLAGLGGFALLRRR